MNKVFAVAVSVLLVTPVAEAQRASKDGSDTYFERGEVHALRLLIAPEDEDQLREAPREYVPFELWVDGERFAVGGGVKLKGAAGSFRDYDDQPAFTVRLDKFDGETLFHGLEKFHLNNSVQDESYLCEWLGSALFREAGVPATRVGHAFVTVNDRDLGLYVLKEGFDKRFLARWFDDPRGNLYDGGFCQDVDAELERDTGKGVEDRSDLAALAEACHDADIARGWTALEQHLDVPAFVRFMALEALVGHWDGYTQNTNNYRLYFVPGEDSGGKAVFLPHGMDQLFGTPDASVLEMPPSLLGATVMKRAEWRKLYRKELKALEHGLDARRLARLVAPVQARLQSALKRRDQDAAEALADRQRELLERIAERAKFLAEEVDAPEPKPLVFRPGLALVVPGWRAHSEVDDAELTEHEQHGARWLTIRAGASGRCVASFRRSVLLGQGRYRLEALARVQGVEPLGDDEEDAPARGATVRTSGEAATDMLVGNTTRLVTFEFEVTEATRDVQLVLELRAAKGELRVRADSLKVTRLAGH